MANFTQQQLEAMGLEEYEPGKYRKKIEESTYKKALGDFRDFDQAIGEAYLENADHIITVKRDTLMLDQALERGKEDFQGLIPSIQEKGIVIKRDNNMLKGLTPDDVMRLMQETGSMFFNGDDFKKIFSVTINNFSEHIVISNKTRAKPYIKGKITPKLPLKYSNAIGTLYEWDDQKRLIDMGTGEIVPSNPGKAGQPKLWRPNGQDIYSDYIDRHARNKYMEKLKEYLLPYFTERPKIEETRLRLELLFYVTDREKHNLDNDNRWIWTKAMMDVLKVTLLPEDDPKIIFSNSWDTYFVSLESDMKMEVIVWAKN